MEEVGGENGPTHRDSKIKRKVAGCPKMSSQQNFLGILTIFLVNSLVLVNAQSLSATTTPSANTITSDSATCQCGVFLLGTGTLTFSADAKPVLAGLPVAANCSASDDKISCATICRQLIQAMSGNQENTPLVQTVVLAATRTLACQRFNESHKVPAPRNFEGTSRQTLAQLDDQKNWKFFVGPSSHAARSDLTAENHAAGSNIDNDLNSEILTEPKWLGGYYRWCDEHWVYAGVSLHEPLCCQGHVPKRCPNYHPEPTSTSTKPSARKGRLIVIKRCPNNVCEDEEEDELDPSSGESNNNKASPTSITRPSLDDGEDETEAPETKDKELDELDEEEQSQKEAEQDDGSTETINPYTTPAPVPSKPLNATVMSEALKFFETLVDGLGYGEIFEGVRSVLPETTAVQLLEKVNHGGWLTHYQDRYIKWPREFSLGYCYMEYSMYNVKNEGGLVPATQNLLERVFGPDRTLPPVGARLPQALPSSQPSMASPHSLYESNMASDINNYIQPMPQMPSSNFPQYDQYEHARLPGNRRVRRGVSVARSYSNGAGSSRLMERRERINNLRTSLRNNTPRRVRPVSRNVPLLAVNDNSAKLSHWLANSADLNATQATLRQYVPLRTYQPSEGNSNNNNNERSSFVPTYPEASSKNVASPTTQQVFPKVYRNNVPYTYDPSQAASSVHTTPVRRSHTEAENNNNHNGNANLAEIARPRRHPGGEERIEDKQQGQSSTKRGIMGPPPPRPLHMPPQGQRNTQPPMAKDGPSAGNLLNIANMLMQTAMASGGSNDGDKVTNMMQTAIPLVAQVANNPAVHSMVNNLVTTFLTPPNSNGPPPPNHHQSSRPTPVEDDEDDGWGESSVSSSSGNKRPTSSKNPIRESDEFSSNEIDEAEISASNTKPVNARPPPNNGGGGGGATDMIASMVQNMISSYIKHIFSPGPGRPPRPSQRPGSSSGSHSPNDKVGNDKPTSGDTTESNDIVDVIANAAKPFFISTFGVVPGDPGYGRLFNRRRDEFKRNGGTSKGHNPNDILTEDPDPGTGIFDILVGPPNFPDTGNKLYDFGNRVVYGFTNANDPQHGVYCFKQYAVNKIWDYFRLGVRALFK